MQLITQLEGLLDPGLLADRQLQATGQRLGIVGTGHQNHDQR